MNWYREKYLKSEHWTGVRETKLLASHCACCLCGFRSISNDVHHIKYRKLYDVRIMELRVLCRTCHDEVHKLLKQYPGLKKMTAKPQWKTVTAHLKSIVMERKRKVTIARKANARTGRKLKLFGAARQLLSDRRWASKKRMVIKLKLMPDLMRDTAMCMALGIFRKQANPLPVLDAYEAFTGRSARPYFWCEGEH